MCAATPRRGVLLYIRYVKCLAFALAAPLFAAFAAPEIMSDSIFVYVHPEQSSFWRTATNSTVTLPIEMPKEVTSARLCIEGDGYERTYENLSGGMYELEFPPATAPDKENVYRLTLTFSDNTQRTAIIGVIEGTCAAAASGNTRCRLSGKGLTWRKTSSRAVIPVSYGMTSLTVGKSGGGTASTDLDGAQGWHPLAPMSIGLAYDLEMASVADSVSANVLAANPGCVVTIR